MESFINNLFLLKIMTGNNHRAWVTYDNSDTTNRFYVSPTFFLINLGPYLAKAKYAISNISLTDNSRQRSNVSFDIVPTSEDTKTSLDKVLDDAFDEIKTKHRSIFRDEKVRIVYSGIR